MNYILEWYHSRFFFQKLKKALQQLLKYQWNVLKKECSRFFPFLNVTRHFSTRFSSVTGERLTQFFLKCDNYWFPHRNDFFFNPTNFWCKNLIPWILCIEKCVKSSASHVFFISRLTLQNDFFIYGFLWVGIRDEVDESSTVDLIVSLGESLPTKNRYWRKNYSQ